MCVLFIHCTHVYSTTKMKEVYKKTYRNNFKGYGNYHSPFTMPALTSWSCTLQNDSMISALVVLHKGDIFGIKLDLNLLKKNIYTYPIVHKAMDTIIFILISVSSYKHGSYLMCRVLYNLQLTKHGR